MVVVDYRGGRPDRGSYQTMGESARRERRHARFGRIAVTMPDPVLAAALTAEGFTLDAEAPGAVGLCCVDVGEDVHGGEFDAEGVAAQLRAIGQRAYEVALVGVGIEACPDWPARMARLASAVDPDGSLPVFAVALDIAADGNVEASGLGELVAWAVAEADAIAGAELARRDAADRLTGLRVGSAAVRSWAGARIHSGFREVASAAQREAASLRAADTAAFVRWVRWSAADFEERMVAAVAEQAAHLRATALVGLPADDPSGEPVPPPTAPPAHGWPRRTWGAEDAVIVLIGASSGFGVGRLAAGSLSGWMTGWTAVVLAVLVGVAVAAGAVALRRRVLLRGQAHAWVSEVVADARARTEWRAAALLNGVEPATTARVRRAASA